MAIEHSCTEARNLIDSLLKHIFRSILTNHRPSSTASNGNSHTTISDETVVLRFSEGVKLLKGSGWEDFVFEIGVNDPMP